MVILRQRPVRLISLDNINVTFAKYLLTPGIYAIGFAMSAAESCGGCFLHIEYNYVVALKGVISSSRHHIIVRQLFPVFTRCLLDAHPAIRMFVWTAAHPVVFAGLETLLPEKFVYRLFSLKAVIVHI